VSSSVLATTETELDTELFMAVTTELGDVVLGPPGDDPGGTGRATPLAQTFQ